jgi:hypothetical protein
MKIHVPRSPPSSDWFWAPNSQGIFTVNSAHIIASGILSATSGPLSSGDWNRLWNLKLQHRHKHLLWRIAWNILPTRQNIFKFKISASLEDKACPICNGPTESTQHIFLDCILAKALWRSSTWPLDYSSFADLSIDCWVKAILHPHEILHIPIFEVENFQLSVVIILDAIWGARNNSVHNKVTPNFQNLVIQVQKTIDIHQQAWTAKDLIASWNPPPIGFIKINFDVAVRPNYMVAAAIISDHDGSLLWATAKKIPLMDINAGEAQAALLAVETATRFYPSSSLILEGDSLITITALNNPNYCTEWSSRGIIADVIFLLSSFSSWSATKVSRSINLRAHLVAKWAASHNVYGSIPTSLPFLSAVRIKSGHDPP